MTGFCKHIRSRASVRLRQTCLLALGLLLAIGVLGGCATVEAPAAAAIDPAEQVQADAAASLVESALAAWEADPEGTIAAINAPGGPWRAGEFYVYIIDEDGVTVAHAANPSLVGLDLSDQVDSDGFAYVSAGLNQPFATGGWWLYRFANPATGSSEPKRDYIRQVGDLNFGVGYYLDDVRYLKHIVADATEVWQTEDVPADTIQTEPRFNRGESYVFVLRVRDLIVLAHPANPELVGSDQSDLTDRNGIKITQQLRALADADGELVEYVFTNPLTGQDEPKQTWAVRVDDVIIGAGIYADPGQSES